MLIQKVSPVEEAYIILGEAKMLENEIDNNATLPASAINGLKYAISYLLDDVLECLVEEYSEKNYKQIRESYEDGLRDSGKYRCDLSDVNDGRGEYLTSSFCENFSYDVNDTNDKKIKKLRDIIGELR